MININFFGEYIKQYGICQKYFDLFYYNFDLSYETLKLFLKNKNEYIKYLDYLKILNNPVPNIIKALDIIIDNFDISKINKNVIEILINEVKTNDKNIYSKIQTIFKLIYSDKEKFRKKKPSNNKYRNQRKRYLIIL